MRYLAEAGDSGAMHDQPLLIDQPATAEPGPDEQGPAQLRGPQRDELWVTPDTRAATLAPYLDSWRRKVERIGTINYPTVARVAGASSARWSRSASLRRQARPRADPPHQRQPGA